MTQPYDDYDQDDDDQNEPAPERNPLRAQLKRLEKEVKTLREQAETGVAATRALEFAKAGINLGDPKAGVFVRGYDGELTEDAIKAAGVDFGLVDAPTTQVADTSPERAASQRMDQAVAGTSASVGRDFDAEMNAASTPADVDRLAAERHQALGLPGPAVVQG